MDEKAIIFHGKDEENISLKTKLDRIRKHAQSKLEHQKQLSIVLSAVETQMTESNTTFSPASYFVFFLALLQDSIKNEKKNNKKSTNNNNVSYSAFYFLNLIIPHVSTTLLRSKFSSIIELLAPVLSSQSSDAPLLKSAIGCLETLLMAQSFSSWNSSSAPIGPRQAINGLLALALDPRPKVRKRSQEAIATILTYKPIFVVGENSKQKNISNDDSSNNIHPAAAISAQSALNAISSLLNKKSKNSNNSTINNQSDLIHTLQLIKAVVISNAWPHDMISPLCELLLQACRSSDQYIIVATFDVFTSIFKSSLSSTKNSKEINQNNDNLNSVLQLVFNLKPALNDQHLTPAWFAIISQGMETYSQAYPQLAFERLPEVFETVIYFLDSSSENVQISAAECLISLVSTCIPTSVLVTAKKSKKSKTITVVTNESSKPILEFLSNISYKILTSVNYQTIWRETFKIFIAFFDSLRWHAAPYFIDSIRFVGSLRSNESFQGAAEADSFIGASIRALGPETILDILPLNLLEQSDSNPGRAWLLPLLRDNISCAAHLEHFHSYFIPLSKNLYDKAKSLSSSSDSQVLAMHAKVYETLIDQVWSIFPRYCDLPIDLKSSFNQEFAELLANILYEKVDLRSSVCQGLRLLVESNKAYFEIYNQENNNETSETDGDELLLEKIKPSDSESNLLYLATFSSNILAVLFNVFTQTVPEYRHFILETINAFLSITGIDDLNSMFENVRSLLNAALQEENKNELSKKPRQKGELPPASHNMMDLVVVMTPYIPSSSQNSLIHIFMQAIKGKDVQLQKKAYRIISSLGEIPSGKQLLLDYINDVQGVLLSISSDVTSPVRASRLQVLNTVVQLIPSSDLHFIPSILPEVVLSTKEVNEKAREAAYTLLISMGKRMQEGGTLITSKVPGMDADAPDNKASLDEYFKMIVAGLAGASSHMVSATVISLSRAFFEFKDSLTNEILIEICSTVELFLTSNNREVVKSVLGFIKIEIVFLPQDIIEPRIEELIKNLLYWSHEHKGHFKSKVKNIFERMLRKFGYERLQSIFPEEDMKLLSNIRKTKERSKRKKANGGDEENDKISNNKSKYSSAYDEALYGSESESNESEDEDIEMADDNKFERNKNKDRNMNSKKQSRSSKHSETYIMENSEDGPVDLLDDQLLAHISSSKPQSRTSKDKNNMGSAQRKGKFEEKNGKIIIKDPSSGNNNNDEDPFESKKPEDSINEYLAAIKGSDAPIRGFRNTLKYKNNRKSLSDDEDNESDGEDKKNFNIKDKRSNGMKKNTFNKGKKFGRQTNFNKSRVQKTQRRFKK